MNRVVSGILAPRSIQMRKIALFFSPVLLMAAVSCATTSMDAALLSDQSARQALPPLSINLGFDVFMLRVDLRRGTHETIEINEKNIEWNAEHDRIAGRLSAYSMSTISNRELHDCHDSDD